MKIKIKKMMSFLPLLLIGLLVLPGIVGAATVTPIASPWSDWSDIQGFIEFIFTVVWFVFTIGVVICFAMAGIKFFTAAGNDTKVQEAKEWVKYGLIGVAVGILAGGMMALVNSLMSSDATSIISLLGSLFV